MAIVINQFFSQAYIWLSLLAGIHCLGVGFYVRYIFANNDSSTSHSNRLLGALFILISLFFFSASITRENAPIQIHFMMTLMVPFYFLLMPLLYSYCKACLQIKTSDLNFVKHILTTLISMAVIVVTVSFNIGMVPDASHIQVNNISELVTINKIALVMPAIILIQSGIYFFLIISALSRHRVDKHQSLKNVRFRWLLLLTGGILLNWVLRLVLVLLPFYFGDTISSYAVGIVRLCLLATIYGFAIYGLHQVTRLVFLRIKVNKTPQHHSAKLLLDNEELDYLRSVISDDKASDQGLENKSVPKT
ncbi:hypothetical protein [Shewanella sp. 10N.286.48.A6]